VSVAIEDEPSVTNLSHAAQLASSGPDSWLRAVTEVEPLLVSASPVAQVD
jgi:hypothetical protein